MNYDFADFLPPDYRLRVARRRSWIARGFVFGTVVAVLIVLTFIVYRQRENRSSYLKSISSIYQNALGRMAEVAELERTKQELSRQLTVLRDVLLRTPASAVMHALAAACPESIELTKVDVRVREASEGPALDVVIEGRCPDHVDAALLMRRMTQADLLGEVRMVKSEKIDAHHDAKKFLITAKAVGLAKEGP